MDISENTMGVIYTCIVLLITCGFTYLHFKLRVALYNRCTEANERQRSVGLDTSFAEPLTIRRSRWLGLLSCGFALALVTVCLYSACNAYQNADYFPVMLLGVCVSIPGGILTYHLVTWTRNVLQFDAEGFSIKGVKYRWEDVKDLRAEVDYSTYLTAFYFTANGKKNSFFNVYQIDNEKLLNLLKAGQKLRAAK